GDGAALAAVVDGDRADQAAARDRLRLEAGAALVRVPAEVLEAGAAPREEVDLLPGVLPHVPDPEVGGAAVEREAPRIADAERLDPDALRRHVDREELPEQRARVLGAVLRVAARAAVAHPDPQSPVRAEGDLAAVVVRVRLPDEEQ